MDNLDFMDETNLHVGCMMISNFYGLYLDTSNNCRRADIITTCFFCPQSTTDGEVETFLQYLCSNDVALPVGGTVRTLVLNKHGGIELSSTVIRNAPNK